MEMRQMTDAQAMSLIQPRIEKAIWDACTQHGLDVFRIQATGAIVLAHRNNGKVMTVNIVHTSHDSVSHPVNRFDAKMAVRKILEDHGINAAVRVTSVAGARS
jgi:hypothetical protein